MSYVVVYYCGMVWNERRGGRSDGRGGRGGRVDKGGKGMRGIRVKNKVHLVKEGVHR
jgi:hypothetical protein